MGGFLLTSPDYLKEFPVRSEQLYYLVKHGHVDYPSLTRKDTKDMDHVDTLAKIIVVWQVTWFIVTPLQCVRQGLPMSLTSGRPAGFGGTLSLSNRRFRK